MKQFGIVHCENLADEVRALVATGQFPGLVTASFGMHCRRQQASRDHIARAFLEVRDRCDVIYIIGCGCWTRIEPPISTDPSPRAVAPDVLREVFLPQALADACIREGSLLLVPGLLARSREYFHCLGFDEVSARECFSESIKQVVLIDTGLDPESPARLARLGETLGVPVRRIPVGLQPFLQYFTIAYLRWQDAAGARAGTDAVTRAERKSADYAMMADMLGTLVSHQQEVDVVREVLAIFTGMFSPRRAGFLPVRDGEPGTVAWSPAGSGSGDEFRDRIPLVPGDYRVTGLQDGFILPLREGRDLLGLVIVEELMFPAYLPEYLNMSRFIVRVAALALANARIYGELERTIAERDAEIIERRRAEEALALASRKLSLLNSITRHDINNQLLVAAGNLELVRERVPDPAQEKYFRNIATAQDRIATMIQFTKAYEQVGVHAPVWQDIRSIVETAAAEAPLGQVRVQNDIPPGIEVYADPLIVKVFYNLMDNAVRHGETITAIRFSGGELEGAYQILCEDDGVGVPTAEKEKIFERGHGKHTGLGLFLAREILSITGITITETGVEGKGARFGILVPEGGYR